MGGGRQGSGGFGGEVWVVYKSPFCVVYKAFKKDFERGEFEGEWGGDKKCKTHIKAVYIPFNIPSLTFIKHITQPYSNQYNSIHFI